MKAVRQVDACCKNCGWGWHGKENFFGSSVARLSPALRRLHYEEQEGPVTAPDCRKPEIVIKFKSLKIRQQVILETLKGLGGVGTTQEIAKKSGLDPNGVSQSLGALDKDYISGSQYLGQGRTRWWLARRVFLD